MENVAFQHSLPALVHEVEQFYFLEADMFDEWRLREWLELLADDVRYFMPMTRNVAHNNRAAQFTRPQQDVAWFDDDKQILVARVEQILSGVHWAEEPLSRISHLVTNVRIHAAEGDTVEAGSRFLIYKNRMQSETDIYVGKRRDILRRTADGLRIAKRTIWLDQNVLLAKNLTTLF